MTTVLASVTVLWVLARFRFPDRLASPNPVPAVLTQLAPRSVFADLAAAIAETELKVLPSIVKLRANVPGGLVPAMRVRVDAAAVVLSADAAGTLLDTVVIGRDPATGLTLVGVADDGRTRASAWTRADRPSRFVLVTSVADGAVYLRPEYFGAPQPATSAAWPGTLWSTPSGGAFRPGAFVFTTSGALVGLVVAEGASTALVPAETVLAAADRLPAAASFEPGTIGVSVQELAAIAGEGVPGAVVVAWVDPDGPSAGKLVATDVIEDFGGPIATLDEWRVRAARVSAGQTVTLQVGRHGRSEVVEITATAAGHVPPTGRLGLTMRVAPRLGVEAIRVEPRSIADVAGIRSGDVITQIGGIAAPTPRQVTRVFGAKSPADVVLAAVTRGNQRLVVALRRR